jgi:hypothetical protein
MKGIPKESAAMFCNIMHSKGTICLAALIFDSRALPQTPTMRQFFHVSCRGTRESPALAGRLLSRYVPLRKSGSASVPPKETWKTVHVAQTSATDHALIKALQGKVPLGSLRCLKHGCTFFLEHGLPS